MSKIICTDLTSALINVNLFFFRSVYYVYLTTDLTARGMCAVFIQLHAMLIKDTLQVLYNTNMNLMCITIDIVVHIFNSRNAGNSLDCHVWYFAWYFVVYLATVSGI